MRALWTIQLRHHKWFCETYAVPGSQMFSSGKYRCLIPSTVLPSTRILTLKSFPLISSLVSPLIISPLLLPLPFAAPLWVPIWIHGLLRRLTRIVVLSLVGGICGILLFTFLFFGFFPRRWRRIWRVRTSFRTGSHLTTVSAALRWKVVRLSTWSIDCWRWKGLGCPLGFSSLRSGIRTLGFIALPVSWLWRCVLQLWDVQRVVLIVDELSSKEGISILEILEHCLCVT